MNWVIIVAGGNGKRLELGYNKIFAKVYKRPLLHWTLKQFEQTPCVHNIIVSAQKCDLPQVEKIINGARFSKIHALFPARQSRQESTSAVLTYLQSRAKSTDLVGIHNAVNPFVTSKEIEVVFQAAQTYGAALLAKPAIDTVKIAMADRFVHTTPLRKHVWHAQTPQVATFDKLWKAYQDAHAHHFSGTDDAQLLERIGVRIKIIPCSHRNFKITFPEDLLLAKQVMKDFQE